MKDPVLADVDPGDFEPWRRFLRAHASITRRLYADLVGSHQLTLSQYEVMLHLARAPEMKMRMSDLAETVLLSRSGISRLISGLELDGLVERVSCSADARGAYARLTYAGLAKLGRAAKTHREWVLELYLRRFSKRDLKLLAELLGALPGASSRRII